ncbi:MAG: DUF2851 family protein [Psychroflexus salarius]
MNEDFIHYLWRFKKIPVLNLQTVNGETVEVIKFGNYNQSHSGPDFKEAIIRLGFQTWAGQVEMHIKSSDWYAHHHEVDSAYDNVILHVVWEHDVDVFQKDQSVLPTLQLKDFVSKDLVKAYKDFMQRPQKFILCEASVGQLNSLDIQFWLERLYIERLSRKSQPIFAYIQQTKQHWDQICFIQLAKSFGLKANAEVFEAVAQSINFKLILQYQSQLDHLEALLLGQANLLKIECEDHYYKHLQQVYRFLQTKHELKPVSFSAEFFRLRPANFPSIRLAQLASLLHQNTSLARLLLKVKRLADLKSIFTIEVSTYWKTHYNFGKESKPRAKQLSASFVQLCIINAISPLQFAYYQFKNTLDFETQVLALVRSLKPEHNSIIKRFKAIGFEDQIRSALETQALLTLKNDYCDQKRCLNCNFGIKLMQQ